MTILDIARQAGVSKSTVSMVMNDSPQISPKTHEKIWALIRELQYEPNLEARRLARRRWPDPAPSGTNFSKAKSAFRLA